jgi:hypothetical protein
MEEPKDTIRPSRAQDIEGKEGLRGDNLPAVPEGAEFRLVKERAAKGEKQKQLTFQEAVFVRAYFENGFNHRDAAQRARIKYQNVAKMIRQPHVRKAMDDIQKAASEELKISQHRIIGDLYEMFTSQLSDVVEHRRGACRYCWGESGRYQWRSEREREDANSVPPGTRRKPTDDEPDRGKSDGGVGYDEYAVPNPDCAECSGQGTSVVLLKDTAGRKGVQSVEYSPNGKVLIKTADKAKIGELLLKHLSMVLHDERHNVPTATPINPIGGISDEFRDALADAGSLEALEKAIQANGQETVSAIELAAKEQGA